jgi:hypothetical protein
MEKLRQAAFLSVGRGVAFVVFGILTLMVGLSYDPVLALRSGGLLLLLLLAALLLKAQRMPETNYQHTEVWVLLDENDRPDERIAGAAVKFAVREACLVFARWTAGVAAVIWASAVLMAALGLGTAAIA